MKRPVGLTPTPQPPEGARPEANEAQQKKPRSARRDRASRRPPASDHPASEADTQPIDIVAPAPITLATALPQYSELSTDDELDEQHDSAAGESKPWWLTGKSDPAARQSAEADRSLAQAERRRRRYERAEARRFTQGTRKRRKRALLGAAGALGLVLLVVLTAYSPLLAVRTISIEGTSRIDAAAVSAALDDQLGRPLTLVDFGEVKSTLEKFPLIQSYVTEARPPDTLVVRIVERRPVVTVAAEGAFQLLDSAGVVVETTPARAPGYPMIDTAATPVDSPGYAAATAVLLALSPDFLAKVDSVGAATPDSVTLVLTSGQRVVWGSAEDSALKARILASMIANPGLPSVSEYDISSPEAPIIH
jgi:cell division septal protein FtsQ